MCAIFSLIIYQGTLVDSIASKPAMSMEYSCLLNALGSFPLYVFSQKWDGWMIWAILLVLFGSQVYWFTFPSAIHKWSFSTSLSTLAAFYFSNEEGCVSSSRELHRLKPVLQKCRNTGRKPQQWTQAGNMGSYKHGFYAEAPAPLMSTWLVYRVFEALVLLKGSQIRKEFP